MRPGRRGRGESVVVESLLRRDTVRCVLKLAGADRPDRGTRHRRARFRVGANPERDKWGPRFGRSDMAREHHCPNCGPEACNASTSKIHTCGVCAAIWEEDLSAPAPAPTPPRPATPAPAPAAAAAAAPKPATPASPVPPKPATPAPSSPTPVPAAPAAPKPAPTAPPAAPKPPTPAAPAVASTPAVRAATPGGKTLAAVVQAAKVKRCPNCTSDSLATPLDFVEVQGRVALQDSQTYRGHWWYADTGEAYVPPGSPPAAAPAAAARPAPSPQPSS